MVEDEATDGAKRWIEDPFQCLSSFSSVLHALGNALELTTSAIEDLVKGAGGKQEARDKQEARVDLSNLKYWYAKKLTSTSDLIPKVDPFSSLDDFEFSLLAHITDSKTTLGLDKSRCATVGDYPWLPPFEPKLRDTLLSTARQCSVLRGVVQTVQDVHGEFPFDISTLDDGIKHLLRLSSSTAICLFDNQAAATMSMCMLRELIRIVRWLQMKHPNVAVDGKRPAEVLLAMYQTQQQAVLETMCGRLVRDAEFTHESRTSADWCKILGHANENQFPISKTSFHERIRGKGAYPLDAIRMPLQKYRLRIDQLPDGTKTEPLRNKIIEESVPSKRGKNRRTVGK